MSAPTGTRRAVHVYAAAVEEEREEARPRSLFRGARALRRQALGLIALTSPGSAGKACSLAPQRSVQMVRECTVLRAYVVGPCTLASRLALRLPPDAGPRCGASAGSAADQGPRDLVPAKVFRGRRA